jgi:hypothetical protein
MDYAARSYICSPSALRQQPMRIEHNGMHNGSIRAPSKRGTMLGEATPPILE